MSQAQAQWMLGSNPMAEGNQHETQETYVPHHSHDAPGLIVGCKACNMTIDDSRILAPCPKKLSSPAPAVETNPDEWPVTRRRKLPDTRPSATRRFEHCGWKGYVTVGFYPDTDQPGEIFITIAKEGTFTSAAIDMIARQTSFLLQRGVPAQVIIDGWRHHVIDPMGPVTPAEQGAKLYNGSLFDVIAESFVACCRHYGDCDTNLDHLCRKVPK